MNYPIERSAAEGFAGLLAAAIGAAILLQGSSARSGAVTEGDPGIARGYSLESEIEVELLRQEELLRAMDRDEQANHALDAFALRAEDLSERADTRIAPRAPRDRELPMAIFDFEIATIAQGAWENQKALTVIVRSLDADSDGNPEQIWYFDELTDALIRKEEDLNYGGTIDSWKIYSDGKLVEHLMDANRDGRIDSWESYQDERMTRRAIDRNYDGVEDAVYIFVGNSLVEERHDRNDDGKVDLIATYRNRRRIRDQEDRNQNGQMDTWIEYTTVDGEEIVVRIERDTDDSGKVDTIEVFETSSGVPILSERHEDKNGDGIMDVRSIYRDGKLIRREISNPDPAPL